MTYMSSIVLLVTSLTIGMEWTAESIIADFYDPQLGSDKPYNITVGIQTTMEYWGLGDEGAFFLKFNEINNQSVILPNHHIRPIVKGDLLERQLGFFVGLELNGVNWNPDAVETVEPVDFLFGGGFSSPTLSSASVSHSFNTPQMSCTATSALLSDMSVYGTFSRTISSDATQSCAWSAIASFFNWTSIGLISSKTDYGLGLSQGFSECVASFNVSIAAEITFESNVEDHSAKLATIANNDVFIYFIAMHNEDLKKLSISLRKMNLTGFPYVYIGGDAAGEDTEVLIENLPGLIYTSPFQVIEATNQLIYLKDRYIVAKMEWEEANNEFLADDIGVFGPHCWDVALIMVDFFQNLTEMYPDNDTLRAGDFWVPFLQNYSNVGATGVLEFDEYLDPMLTRWTINNCDDATCNVIGEVTSTDGLASLTVVEIYYDNNMYDGTADVYWPSGETGILQTPRDRSTITIKWIYITDRAKIFYGVFCGITILVSIFLTCLSYRWRNEHAVRITSWKLNIITLIGLNIMQLCFAFMLMDEKVYSSETLDSICFVRYLSFSLGFPLFAGTIFSKIYRVHKIFNARRLTQQKNPLRDTQIIEIVAMYMAVNLICVVVFQLIHPWRRDIVTSTAIKLDLMNFEQSQYGTCEMDEYQSWQIVLVVTNGSVLVLGAKWAWETRGVKLAALNDSVQVGYILMLILLLFAFNTICLSLLDDPNSVFFITFTSLLLVAWFTIGVLFLHKYWSIICGKDDEDEEYDRDETNYQNSRETNCPHCNKNFVIPSYIFTDRKLSTISRPTTTIQLSNRAPSNFDTRISAKTKTIEDMADEFLDELSNNSALEEDDQDKPLTK